MKTRPLDIAIVGMACRFPGARDVAAFWENVRTARVSLGDVPPDRWDPAVFLDPDSTANDRVYSQRGGYLDAPIEFDPTEFGIMPLAVAGGEPEQFLVLDAARAALIDAGLGAGVRDGRRVEVVIGRGNYFNRGNLTRLQHGRIVAQTLAVLRQLHPDWTDDDFEVVRSDLKSSLPPFEPATIAGQLTNATAGRIANRLDLTGASYVVDAASASSLVAVDLAARALRDRRADLALAGGVYLAADVDFPLVFARLGALSRSGQARPFGRNADGMLPGEGVGVVVLKRLADAERDGDRIYAVVKGIGLASDGRQTSLAAPSARGHARAIRRAYRQSGIDPATVALIEGHGLGVPASDRAELRALRAVFPRPERGQRLLGAVSALIGHAMPAAGIAGLIKTALALHHRVLPPSGHADTPHPLLRDESSPVAWNPAARPWIHGDVDAPRRAGVNAFGFAGASAHAVLEEHSATADGLSAGCQPRWETEAVLLGAADRSEWLDRARGVLGWLERGSNLAVTLKDLAYTFNVGAAAGRFRVGMVVASPTDLRDRLRTLIDRIGRPECHSVRDARGSYFWDEPLAGPGALAFLYPGEGSQYPGMLADQCLHVPEVRPRVDIGDRVAIDQGLTQLPSAVLFGAGAEGGPDLLWSMGTAVNVVITAQWSLHGLLTGLGLRPDAVVGHSSGEFLALSAAGALTIDRTYEDRIGQLGALFESLENSGQVPGGALVAVAADRDRVEALGGDIRGWALAMDNCPHQVVLAGAPAAIDAVTERLKRHGIICDRLPFERAYHTPEFAPALGPIAAFFDSLSVQPPRVPIYSCASAARMDDVATLRKLAVEQWALPVRFRSTVEAMHADGVRIFVEVGARGNLTGFVEDALRGRPHFAIAANLPRRSGLTQLNHLTAALFAQGVDVQPEVLYARRRPERIDLGRDLPVPARKPELKVGFPEMVLSEGVAAALRNRAHVNQPASNGSLVETNGHGHAPSPRWGPPIAAIVDPAPFDAIPTLPFASSPTREEAIRAHLATMDIFLETQRQVMSAFLAGGVEAPAGPASVAVERPAPPTIEPELPTLTVRAEEALLEQVSRRTGYPREMLELDLDMEGDLGIDSIKRVEILGELQGQGMVPDGMDMDRLSRCRTLRQVIALLEPPRTPPSGTPGPWAGTIARLVPGRELVTVRRLDARDDPVAAHHTIGGRKVSALDPERKGLPVLPFTVMAEMLAQAAAALVPDGVVTGMRDVQAHKWVRYEVEPVDVELRATRDPARPDEVHVAIHRTAAPSATRRETAAATGPVVEGTVVFGTERPPAPEAGPFALPEAGTCRFTAEELYRDQWLFHGPALQAVTHVGPSSPHGIAGTLRVLPRAGLFRPSERAEPHTDPIVLDAFTHLLGCWGLDQHGDNEGDVIFPLRLGELSIFGTDPGEGAEITCRILVREASRFRVRVDAELVRPDGRLWMRLKDWEDWRFYWPGRVRDHFRKPDHYFLGEPLDLPGANPAESTTSRAVWLALPPDMAKPVWRDVLEWVQLGPDERTHCRAFPGPDRRFTMRLWGRIAAKEAARRLWRDAGAADVYPADFAIDPDPRGRPRLRSLGRPERTDLPAVSIAHTEGVAVALAAVDPTARLGIDVERIVDREAGFEAAGFTDGERAWLDDHAGADRAEWIARFWCAKEAVAKATGFGMIVGPCTVEVIAADRDTGAALVGIGPDLAAACPDWGRAPTRALTARRGDCAWAWTLGAREEVQ